MARLPGQPRTPPAIGLTGIWRATVATTSPLTIIVPRLTGSSPVGPCETADLSWIAGNSTVTTTVDGYHGPGTGTGTVTYPALKTGDAVWAMPIEGRRDSFAVIARRQ